MLTDAKLKAAKPAEKQYTLNDSRGLFLLVKPTGVRLWRLRLRRKSGDTSRGLGQYPEVGLKAARQAADKIRNVHASSDGSAKSFRVVAGQWLDAQHHLAPATHQQRWRRLELYALPWIGDKPISAIKPPDVLAALRRGIANAPLMPDQTGAEQARRVRADLSRIFRFGVAAGHCERDPAADIRDALPKPAAKNYAAVAVEQLPAFLAALEAYPGEPAIVEALRFQLLTIARPGMVRLMTWDELDGDLWRVPAERMKKRRGHVVPLSRQALACLNRIRPWSGDGLVFPSRGGRPLSENGQRNAIHCMGFQATAHGLRATASSVLQELGYDDALIKLALSHDKDKTSAAYLRSPLVQARREMLQHLADYLDGLGSGADVTPE